MKGKEEGSKGPLLSEESRLGLVEIRPTLFPPYCYFGRKLQGVSRSLQFDLHQLLCSPSHFYSLHSSYSRQDFLGFFEKHYCSWFESSFWQIHFWPQFFYLDFFGKRRPWFGRLGDGGERRGFWNPPFLGWILSFPFNISLSPRYIPWQKAAATSKGIPPKKR